MRYTVIAALVAASLLVFAGVQAGIIIGNG